MHTEDALDQLMARYQSTYAEAACDLITEAHDEWQAPIYVQPLDDDRVRWQPVRQTAPLVFTDLIHALEQPFHPDIPVFFGRWYAGDLNVTYQHHPLILLQNHCQQDGERLLANMAGHVLMKRRLKQPITLFIGLAEESDDLLISLDNETGVIGLEFVGMPQHEKLADSLADFLQDLTPRVVE